MNNEEKINGTFEDGKEVMTKLFELIIDKCDVKNASETGREYFILKLKNEIEKRSHVMMDEILDNEFKGSIIAENPNNGHYCLYFPLTDLTKLMEDFKLG